MDGMSGAEALLQNNPGADRSRANSAHGTREKLKPEGGADVTASATIDQNLFTIAQNSFITPLNTLAAGGGLEMQRRTPWLSFECERFS